MIELKDVAADHLGHVVTDHLVHALAGPFQERLVREAVALAAVDVGDRDAERVELALRQREQRLATQGLQLGPVGGIRTFGTVGTLHHGGVSGPSRDVAAAIGKHARSVEQEREWIMVGRRSPDAKARNGPNTPEGLSQCP